MHQFEQFNEENKVPLQAVAEARMPAHLKERLQKSEQLKKQARSLEQANRETVEANVRRDEGIAQKVMTAIETREKHFEPKELREARKQYDRELKLQYKMERAAEFRRQNELEKIEKAQKLQEKNVNLYIVKNKRK